MAGGGSIWSKECRIKMLQRKGEDEEVSRLNKGGKIDKKRTGGRAYVGYKGGAIFLCLVN